MSSSERTAGRQGPPTLPAFGIGTAALGGMFDPVSADQAQAVLRGAAQRGIRYVDTAPMYGLSTAERRVGALLDHVRGDGEMLVSTKVGRLMRPRNWPGVPKRDDTFGWRNAGDFVQVYDYSHAGIQRSLEDSLQRLGVGVVDVAFVHDIGRDTHGDRNDGYLAQLRSGGYRALAELKDAGVIRAVGVGVNEIPALRDCLADTDLDCALLANQFTLLSQPDSDEVFAECARRGVQLVAGGVYNSGVLAGGDHFGYQRTPPQVRDRVDRLRAVCDRFGVPLKAAALQFVTGSGYFACVMLGARDLAELDDSLAMAALPVPEELWAELARQGLVAERWIAARGKGVAT
ncbi:aldo/keto reductase [Micromonospora sp. WMMD882]|uniref:aldo/keto reductase n=1 Tax=Micromonospora sp. WMMD882 TaxID=3015151 RepID=UPI00248C7701|nr:aldo/keto reductase [Micromonospora sp. WMMD882]WBB80322.1 aldo/keto reductase [Micromonospora sp. WMMD882]